MIGMLKFQVPEAEVIYLVKIFLRYHLFKFDIWDVGIEALRYVVLCYVISSQL